MKGKITGKLLAAQKGPFTIWDTEVRGFAARRQTDDGRIIYLFRYQDGGGRKREVRIGDAQSMDAPEVARAAAKIHAGKVAKEGDPAADRQAARRIKTLNQIWDEYTGAALWKRRPRVQTNYRSTWAKHIQPHLGAKRLTDITPEAVEAMHKAITNKAAARKLRKFEPPTNGGRTKRARWSPREGGPRAANAALQLLSLLCNRAKLSPNPCTGVERNPEVARDIRLSDEELALIMRALGEESDTVRVAFGLFLETPNRHSIIAAAEWEEFADLGTAAPTWTISGEKMKGGRSHTCYLSEEMGLQIAAHRLKQHNRSPRYLFPRSAPRINADGARPLDVDLPRVTFKHDWARIRSRALALATADVAASCRALKIATIHAFKHTYLQRLADVGASAMEIKTAGDHQDIRTSMVYASRAVGRQRELQEKARPKFRAA